VALRRRSLPLYLKRAAKGVRFKLRPAAQTIPVFIFGQQRSGSGMLTTAFDWNDDCRVYEEGDKRAFTNHRIPDLSRVEQCLARSGAKRDVYKPLCDSHRVREFMDRFPEARIIWLFRDYLGVSRSAVRRFPNAHLRLRAIATGQRVGNWFDEGLSDAVRSTLQSVYRPEMSPRECACLTWWARNMIVIEQDLAGRAWFADYDDLVRNKSGFASMFRYVGLELDPRTLAFVHAESSRPEADPGIGADVRSMCSTLLTTLRELAAKNPAA
jgi:hypothetical protein